MAAGVLRLPSEPWLLGQVQRPAIGGELDRALLARTQHGGLTHPRGLGKSAGLGSAGYMINV